MCILRLLFRHFNVDIIAIAAQHLTSAGRASLNVAAPMVEVSVHGTAVGAAFTRLAPTLLTITLTPINLAVAVDPRNRAPFGFEHLPSADITLRHQSATTFRQMSTP